MVAPYCDTIRVLLLKVGSPPDGGHRVQWQRFELVARHMLNGLVACREISTHTELLFIVKTQQRKRQPHLEAVVMHKCVGRRHAPGSATRIMSNLRSLLKWSESWTSTASMLSPRRRAAVGSSVTTMYSWK
jgi:hypothetical protein